MLWKCLHHVTTGEIIQSLQAITSAEQWEPTQYLHSLDRDIKPAILDGAENSSMSKEHAPS